MTTSPSINCIGIVGLTHLGITWSIGYASLGFQVVAFDSDETAVGRLKNNDSIVPEPGLPELFRESSSRIEFSSNPNVLKRCDVVFFAYDVPYNEEGVIDLIPVHQLLDLIIPHLAPNVEFIFMGQVPVGFTRKLNQKIREKRPHLPFNLIYRVETITIGQAVSDFLNPDRVIIGLENSKKELTPKALKALQEPFKCPIVKGSYESAELTKSAINIYLANAVTFVNTISDLCEKTGANIQEIVAAMKIDKRFSPYCYWRPGLGFAGGHLERDLMSLSKLSEENGIEPTLLTTIIQNSKKRYQWLVNALEKNIYQKIKNPTLCLWGLAYKKGTDSLHNAHCVKIFRDYGQRAKFKAYDPQAKLPESIKGVEVFQDKFEALKGTDGLIILTEWEEFVLNDPRPFLERMKRPVIIDGVQILGQEIASHPGIHYIAMGIPVKEHAKQT